MAFLEQCTRLPISHKKLHFGTMPSARRTYTIRNSLGLHARPASKLVRIAMQFESDILCISSGQTGNAKSVMALMMLAVECGASITIEADGADAQDAVAAMGTLIENAFDESV